MDSIKDRLNHLEQLSSEYLESLTNVKDLSVILMENALIEQALDNHRMVHAPTPRPPA